MIAVDAMPCSLVLFCFEICLLPIQRWVQWPWKANNLRTKQNLVSSNSFEGNKTTLQVAEMTLHEKVMLQQLYDKNCREKLYCVTLYFLNAKSTRSSTLLFSDNVKFSTVHFQIRHWIEFGQQKFEGSKILQWNMVPIKARTINSHK